MTALEYTLTILRGDSRPVMMAFKGLVNGQPLDLTGSTFALTLFDVRGQSLLTQDGEIGDDNVVSFAIPLEDKSSLPAGRSGRWRVTRTIDGNVEGWASGNTLIAGAV